MSLPRAAKSYHRLSKNLYGIARNSGDSSKWPQEWKTIYYKTYDRFPKIVLPQPQVTEKDIFSLISSRQSKRDFTGQSLTLTEISTLLKYSCGIFKSSVDGRDNEHRAQPSGGARFPVEAYLLNLKPSPELEAGVYHYNVKQHALEFLWKDAFDTSKIDTLAMYPWVKDASMLLVLTGVFRRTCIKYGERGYRYMLLESGHIGQNIYLVSSALKLGCVGLGGVYEDNLEKLLDLDSDKESVLYTLVLGK